MPSAHPPLEIWADLSLQSEATLPSLDGTLFLGFLGKQSGLRLTDYADFLEVEDPSAVIQAHQSQNSILGLVLPTFDQDTDWFEVKDRLAPWLEQDGFGLALDTSLALKGERRPALYRRVEAQYLVHCRLADRPRDGAQGICLPGLGILNLGGLIRLLSRSGFLGSWSLRLPPSVAGVGGLIEASNALLNLFHEVGEDTPELKRRLSPLPGKAKGKGIEFIEFAVNQASQDELEQQLRALRFRKERVHKTKPVTLWRQGAINLVLNQAPAATRTLPTHEGPFVCDMGLRVQEVGACVARSEAMGAKPFSTTSTLEEVQIPAILEDSGSIVHFLDEQSHLHRVWDLDFDEEFEPWAGPTAGLRRIDHVAQTYTRDEMRRWMVFYLSTFNMTARSPFDVSDPAGQVASRALETPEGEIRLTLNGTNNLDTLAGQFVASGPRTSVQHIAFQTDDIFETSDLIAAAGFERLEIEGAYYVELSKSYDLSVDVIDRLRSNQILYSEDPQGHFFQIYSKPLNGGLFFEIVQRVDGYAGYGAANAAVRIRAQTSLQQSGDHVQ